MAESFENLDNILHDWAKDEYKKSTVEALNRYEKHSLAGKRKINRGYYTVARRYEFYVRVARTISHE